VSFGRDRRTDGKRERAAERRGEGDGENEKERRRTRKNE
jgi:hypothetical protein